jgi:hypothetical protein
MSGGDVIAEEIRGLYVFEGFHVGYQMLRVD